MCWVFELDLYKGVGSRQKDVRNGASKVICVTSISLKCLLLRRNKRESKEGKALTRSLSARERHVMVSLISLE